MSFAEKIKKHLSAYKEKNFPHLEDGVWTGNKQQYSHILPENSKYDNFLKPYKGELIDYINNNKVPLHHAFHHLVSSQAMCLNFFYPLFYERKLELITEFIGLRNEKVKYETVCFEKRGLEGEYGRVPTSFDLYLETISDKRVYFEIKYTEGSFGSNTINSDKFDTVYSKFLTPIKDDFHDEKSFYKNFQILRNLIHISGDSYVVFVYPEDNKGIKKGVDKVKTDFLKPTYFNHFFASEWNALFEYVSKKTTKSKMQEQYAEFKNKYLEYR